MCDFSAVHTHDFAAIRCSAGPEKKEDKDYLDEQQKQLKRFKKKGVTDTNHKKHEK